MDDKSGIVHHPLMADNRSYQGRLAGDAGRLFCTKETNIDFHWRRWLTG